MLNDHNRQITHIVKGQFDAIIGNTNNNEEVRFSQDFIFSNRSKALFWKF